MNFISRRSSLLTRDQILAFILESAIEGLHQQALNTPFPTPEKTKEVELATSTLQACHQAVDELNVPPEEAAVARGVLVQQVALHQAIQLLEQKYGRELTPSEKERIVQNLPQLLPRLSKLSPVPASEGQPLPSIRGPRLRREGWGH